MRQFYVLQVFLTTHSQLTFKPEFERLPNEINTRYVKVLYTDFRSPRDTSRLIATRQINILKYIIPVAECKKTVVIWPKTLTYDETESLIKTMEH